jgi:hypothetical protein
MRHSRRRTSRRTSRRKHSSRTRIRKSSRTRRTSRKNSSRSRSKCRQRLSRKIAINMRERRYSSPSQAIAVAYAQIRKRYPQCSRALSRSSRKRSSRRR